MTVLTFSNLIPCRPSPPPPSPPPEIFHPGQFTSALPLHCSSYIDFHCISKKVRPFSANFSNVFSMTEPTFHFHILYHPRPPLSYSPSHRIEYRLFVNPLHWTVSESFKFHCITKNVRSFSAGFSRCFPYLYSPSNFKLLNIHLLHNLLLLHNVFSTDDNVGGTLIFYLLSENNQSWMHFMQVSIMMHLSKKCTFNFCIISNIVFVL